MSEGAKHLTIGMFMTVLAFVLGIWGTLYGYSFVRVTAVEDRQPVVEANMSEIKTTMAEIKTDVRWLIQSQNKR